MIALYIADVTVSIVPESIPFEEYVKSNMVHVRVLDEYGKLKPTPVTKTIPTIPVLLNEGEFPSPKYEAKFIQKHFPGLVGKNYKYVVSFENVKYSSRIMYEFKD